MLCSTCSAQLAPATAFCQTCGTAVTPPPAAAAPVQPTQKKRSWFKTCLVVSGALFVLLVVCVIVGVLLGPPPPQQARAGVPEKTAEPAPTTAPEPAEVLQPTAVPEPAEVLQPTAVPEPTAVPPAEPPTSSALQTYFTAIAPVLVDYGTWLGRVGEQSTKAGENPQLVHDGEWKVQTTTALVALNDAATKMQALPEAPQEARAIGVILRQIADETEPMTGEYMRGVDDMDASLITSAAGRMNRIAGWATDLQTEMALLQP